MIARIWTGATRASDAAAYQRHMQETALPGHRTISGNRGVLMLRHDRDDGRTDFTMITLWDDMVAVRRFAGQDPERAVFYPDDEAFLVERNLQVTHHEAYALAL